MKFFTIFILLFSYSLYSQIDKGNSIAIPATTSRNTTKSNLIPPSTSIAPNIDFSTFSKPKSDKFKIGESEGVNFGGKRETFADPAEEYNKKMNKKYGKEPDNVIKGNQFFGEFRNSGEFVNVIYRDHEYPDGDMIKVSVNDVVVVPSITLESDFKGLSITLKPGFNKIDFEALNQGFSGPNTAEFHVYDDKKNLISADKWNLATGFKATIIVIKE